MDDDKTFHFNLRSTSEADVSIAKFAGALGIVTTAGVFLAAKYLQRRTLDGASRFVNNVLDLALETEESE